MKFAICMGLLALAAAPAFAAPACYSPTQLEAEQWLRLHSELMVITVTCREGSSGENLPAAYGDFTHKNIAVLHDAEQTMIAYYKAHGGGDATASLDRLRTKLGNEFGQKSADMSAPAFCAAYRDKVWQFDAASPVDVGNEVKRMEAEERSYVPSCAGATTVAARKPQ